MSDPTEVYGASNVVDTVGCMDNTILTASGGYFDFAAPTVEQIHIGDIAKALSNTCRFGGQCDFYSVAEHCCHCFDLARLHDPSNVALHRLALLHDAAEAYIGDVPKPLKNMLPEYRRLETSIEAVVADRFSLDGTLWPDVKRFDLCMLKAEKKHLFPDDKLAWNGFAELEDVDVDIQCWGPGYAGFQFLQRFADASGAIEAAFAKPGVWYESEKWGRVLCCGTSGGNWLMAFAVRIETGQTELRFLGEEMLLRSEQQSW